MRKKDKREKKAKSLSSHGLSLSFLLLPSSSLTLFFQVNSVIIKQLYANHTPALKDLWRDVDKSTKADKAQVYARVRNEMTAIAHTISIQAKVADSIAELIRPLPRANIQMLKSFLGGDNDKNKISVKSWIEKIMNALAEVGEDGAEIREKLSLEKLALEVDRMKLENEKISLENQKLYLEIKTMKIDLGEEEDEEEEEERPEEENKNE